MKREKGKSWGGLVAALVLAVPILYVLSIGPMGWLVVHEIVSEDVFEKFYLPLLYLFSLSESGMSMLRSYIDWWVN